jgi:hypothetical protein
MYTYSLSTSLNAGFKSELSSLYHLVSKRVTRRVREGQLRGWIKMF